MAHLSLGGEGPLSVVTAGQSQSGGGGQDDGADIIPINPDQLFRDDDKKGKKGKSTAGGEVGGFDYTPQIKKAITKSAGRKTPEEIAKTQALLIKVNRLLSSPRFC